MKRQNKEIVAETISMPNKLKTSSDELEVPEKRVKMNREIKDADDMLSKKSRKKDKASILKKGDSSARKKNVIESSEFASHESDSERDTDGTPSKEEGSYHKKSNTFAGKAKSGKHPTPLKDGKPEKKELTDAEKKELRIKKKTLKKERREKERGYTLPEEAKKIFEEMRCNKCPSERRQQLAGELYNILAEKLTFAVRSHDLARMVQWIIHVGTPEVRVKTVSAIMNNVLQLSKTKYSNHLVLRILKDCDKKTRKQVMNCLIGNISMLMKTRFSSTIVEQYYSKYAKSKEKAFFRQELYSDFFKGGKNPELTSLSVVLSQNPTLKSAILNNTKTILSKLLDKPSALGTTLVTDVLLDYLNFCEEKDKLDMIDILKTNLKILMKTKSGCKVVMHLLWESTAKVKKTVVKELKTYILDIIKSDGNIFIRSLFDSVDDTVLIKKAILPTILENAEEIVKNHNGRKVILYIVAHRDPAYFHPMEIEELKKADEAENVKKDIALKNQELLEPCVEALLLKIKENTKFWFSESAIILVTFAILNKSSGPMLAETYDIISNYISGSMLEGDSMMLEDPAVHMFMKKLIKKETDQDEHRFSVSFAKCLNENLVKKLITVNRGCFLLVHLIETNFKKVHHKITKCFKDMDANVNVVALLEKSSFQGAKILNDLIKKHGLI